MKKNDLIKTEDGIYRILSIEANRVLAIDCIKKTMPKFYPVSSFGNGELIDRIPADFPDMEDLSPADRKIAQERYTMIAGAVSVVDDIQQRNLMIEKSSNQFRMSKQSIRSFLCSYLVYQDVSVLAPKQSKEKELTEDQKNMRWALNKFFYTRNQNSLPTAYAMMLKSKYCDAYGVLLPEYPSYNQFRYFYRKHRKMENYYISRDGIKDYQRNKRPLLGDGVQEFAPAIGTAMLDGTTCDIYLVNESGQLVGRPVLVIACDANTSLCLGYSLLWEGGTYSLQTLMLNILEDKVALCESMGIRITSEQWAVNQLPAVMVTDGGSEYKGQTFEQIAELGVTLVNLPSYRPELKGTVEKLFDLVQNSYKDLLKGKGVIMPDFQERGSHDYRKDAVLTMEEFEKIVVRCIVHYNCERVIQNYPYTTEMLADGVLPYANTIWNWKKDEAGTNLIDVSAKDLVLTLLPRTTGKFTKYGLKANRLRYYADGYKEQFLQGGDAVVAYNPDNCNKVWVREKDGSFVEFSLMDNIEYEILLENNPYDREMLEEILELLVDTVCATKKYIRVAGSDYPAEVVRSRLLKLNAHHIDFVISCFKENTTKVRNVKQYLLTSLYNAPVTIDSYTLEEVDTATKYVVPDSQTAAIEWNSVTNKSFANILKKWNYLFPLQQECIVSRPPVDFGRNPPEVLSHFCSYRQTQEDLVALYIEQIRG